ncbi:peptide chain release factor aRF-1 [archaeon]|nr:peptide chain release factor aRF-1 [archaeon]
MKKLTRTEVYKLRRAIRQLARKKGRGTELISLYIPPGRPISDVISMLRQELSTAANIKSRTTRKNVMAALERVIQRLKLFKSTPPNGLVIFSGAIPRGPPGSERMEIYVLEPPLPLQTYLYRCDNRFHTEILEQMLSSLDEVYGLLLLDTSGASVSLIRGSHVEIVKEMESGIPGKHSAGGQSARRFERLREMEVNLFFHRVGKWANKIFLSEDRLQGIIVGGPAHTKNEFLEGDYLDYRLKDKIIAIIDVADVDEQGVKQALAQLSSILKDARITKERELGQRFLSVASKSPNAVAIGYDEVLRRMREGVVDTVLIVEDLSSVIVTIKCNNCGYHFTKVVEDPTQIRKLVEVPCPNCNSYGLAISGEKEVVDAVLEEADNLSIRVEIISSSIEEGVILKKAFGGVVAILKWA